MPTLDDAVSALTTQTTNLLTAVNVNLSTLTQKVTEATTQANLATTNGEAQVALATTQANLATTNGEAQVALAATQANLSTTNGAAQVALATSQANLATTNGAAQAALAATQASAALTSANNTATANTSAQTALAGTTSAAAQAANARDQAILASQVATAGNENLAAMALRIHYGAVVAAKLYDTTKDSDGGAWRKKCQHTSWYQAAINGAWLGQAAGELAARGDNLMMQPEDLTQSAANTWNQASSGTVAVTVANKGGVLINTLVGSATNIPQYTHFISLVATAALYAFSFDARATDGSTSLNIAMTGAVAITAQAITAVKTRYTLLVSASGNGAFGFRLANNQSVEISNCWLNKVGAVSSTYSGSPELVTNGGFDNGTVGWIASASAGSSSAVVSGSAALITGDGTNSAYLRQAISGLTAGKVYSLTYTLLNYVVAFSRYNGSGYTGYTGGGSLAVGSSQYVFTATNATEYFEFLRGGLGTATLDNISVKEVTALSTPYVPYSSLAGAYYQSTTDGKFYALGATYGAQVEIFNGNSREFPAQVAWLAESGRVIGYDLTQVGCPMWMVFVGAGSTAANTAMLFNSTITSCAASSGMVFVGAGTGVYLINFITDQRVRLNDADTSKFNGSIADRNILKGQVTTGTSKIVNQVVSAIDVTILPTAPVDPATGLQVPTVYVGTAGGLSTIKSDGTVVNDTTFPAGSAAIHKLGLTRDGRLMRNWNDANRTGVLKAGIEAPTSTSDYNLYGSAASALAVPQLPNGGGSAYGFSSGAMASTNGLILIKENPSDRTKTMVAAITPAYNTGWQVGDSRACYLSDIVAETITASGEMVANGTFATDTNGSSGVGGATLAAVGGELEITGTGGAFPGSLMTIAGLAIGKSYVATCQGRRGTTASAVSVNAGAVQASTSSATTTPLTVTFLATGTTQGLTFLIGSATGTGTAYFDNISVKLATPDRSVKNNGAILYGAIIKSGAQIVTYSGFSATNYFRAPWSSAQEYGTGECDVGAWVSTLEYAPHNLVGNSSFANGLTDVPIRLNSTDVTAVAGLSGGFPHSTGIHINGGVTGYAYVGGTAATSLTTSTMYTLSAYVSMDDGSAPTPNDVRFALANAGLLSPTTITLISGTVYRISVTALGANSVANTGINAPGVAGKGFTFTGFQVTRVGASLSAYYPTLTSASYNGIALITDRSAATGPSFKLGIDGAGKLAAIWYDGTTTRTATSPGAINTGLLTMVGATYRTDGSLALNVNGKEVIRTTGAPLLTMNNPLAVLTIGNSLALDAPFPGSITMLAMSATAPSTDQTLQIYRDELELFQPGAQCTLAGTSASVTALAFDDSTGLLDATTSYGVSTFHNLLRVSSAVTPVGGITSISSSSGAKLLTGNLGASYTQPSMQVRGELRRAIESKQAMGMVPQPYWFTGDGTTTSFTFPLGVSHSRVYKQGMIMRDGIGMDYTITFDGYRSTIVFVTAPSLNNNICLMGVYK